MPPPPHRLTLQSAVKYAAPFLATNLGSLPLVARGKVRDIYALGDDLLFVATDRISAFDHVLGSGIPDKGKDLKKAGARKTQLL